MENFPDERLERLVLFERNVDGKVHVTRRLPCLGTLLVHRGNDARIGVLVLFLVGVLVRRRVLEVAVSWQVGEASLLVFFGVSAGVFLEGRS
jgi:hypothetical protein